LSQRLETAAQELCELRSLEDELASATETLEAARADYVDAAAKLTTARGKAARSLARAVSTQLESLAFPEAKFEVALRPARGERVECAEGDPVPLGSAGAEYAEFLLAANPGEPLRPLAQVASGGELSRVMLALHVVASCSSPTRSLVFDEVDAGVGGAVADAVGARLATLARSQQVLCVTHLPQVAAYADHHLRVRKRVRNGRTTAEIEDLAAEGRVEELARMLGGKRPSETSRRHASEMLTAAERPRPTRRRA
jgi:DNA repair protein RecN (Recombination protein N)